jgi:hypothetical protein
MNDERQVPMVLRIRPAPLRAPGSIPGGYEHLSPEPRGAGEPVAGWEVSIRSPDRRSGWSQVVGVVFRR